MTDDEETRSRAFWSFISIDALRPAWECLWLNFAPQRSVADWLPERLLTEVRGGAFYDSFSLVHIQLLSEYARAYGRVSARNLVYWHDHVWINRGADRIQEEAWIQILLNLDTAPSGNAEHLTLAPLAKSLRDSQPIHDSIVSQVSSSISARDRHLLSASWMEVEDLCAIVANISRANALCEHWLKLMDGLDMKRLRQLYVLGNSIAARSRVPRVDLEPPGGWAALYAAP